MAETVVVIGARNLGGAILDHFLQRGRNAAGVARSDDTLEQVTGRGALALPADASDPEQLRAALSRAREEFGSLNAVVNATIESPKTAAFTSEQPRNALADQGQVAAAVGYLVDQGDRALTHELTVTPAGDRWVP